jgi:hypothetical protein
VCEECATLVAKSELHRDALLHAIRLDPGSDHPRPASAVDDAHRELVTWASRALERVTPVARTELGAGLSENLRSELPKLASALDPATYRMALAVSEAALAVRSLVLRNERTILGGDGSLVLRAGGKERRVPSTYVAARIAQHVDLSPDAAANVWSVVAKLAIDGRLGLPSLPAVDHQADGALLAIEDADAARTPPRAVAVRR